LIVQLSGVCSERAGPGCPSTNGCCTVNSGGNTICNNNCGNGAHCFARAIPPTDGVCTNNGGGTLCTDVRNAVPFNADNLLACLMVSSSSGVDVGVGVATDDDISS
jgi:hypothetical protein